LLQVVATPPATVVELLLMKGPNMGQLAVQFAEAYRMDMEATVRLLADACFKVNPDHVITHRPCPKIGADPCLHTGPQP
jgi:hypothetical protein